MTSYMGDELASTNKVDVFYAEKDVKLEYKVIGHIYSSTGVSTSNVKASIVKKAKSVGADAVIVPGPTTIETGKNESTVQQADAIKYEVKTDLSSR